MGLSFLLRCIFISCIFFSAPSLAAEFPDIDSKYCNSKIQSLLQEWKAKKEWHKQPIGSEQFLYSSPTDKIGVWVQVRTTNSKETTVSRIESTNITNATFFENQCSPKISLSATKKTEQKENRIDDEKLRKSILNGRRGFIYTWSTAMPLSIDGITEIQKAAQSKKLDLIVVLDENADFKQAVQIVKQKNWPKEYLRTNASLELRFRGAFNHFPSVLVYQNTNISPKLIPGLRNALFYEKLAKEFGL